MSMCRLISIVQSMKRQHVRKKIKKWKAMYCPERGTLHLVIEKFAVAGILDYVELRD